MMNTIPHAVCAAFSWVVSSSLQASVLAGLILLVQWLFRKRLPARWLYALWLLLVVRLLMPFVPESPTSVFNLTNKWLPPEPLAPSEQVSMAAAMGERNPAVAPSREVSSLASQAVAREAADATPIRGLLWISIAWLVVSLAIAGRVALGNYRLSSRVCRQRPVTNQAVLDVLEDCKQEMDIHIPINVVESPVVKSPALLGFVRPRLLLPERMIGSFGAAELRHVFRHELAHLKRGDVIVNWGVSAMQVVHWFNPLLWVAFRRMRADCETACDALALSASGEEENRNYGETIIKLLEFSSYAGWLPGAVGILEDRTEMKRRLTMIAARGAHGYRWSPLATVLLVVLALVGLTAAQSQDVPCAPTVAESGAPAAVASTAAPVLPAPAPADAPIPSKVVVAMNPLSTSPGLESERDAVSDILQAQLSRSTGILLVDREQMHKVLEELKLGEQGMLTPESARQLGDIVGARYFCSGTLTRNGVKIMVTVKVIDVQTTLTKLSCAFLNEAGDAEAAGTQLAEGIRALIAEFESDRVAREQALTASAAKPIPAFWKRPSVMVIIREMHVRQPVLIDPAAETEFVKRLLAERFPVIDSEFVTVMRRDELRARSILSDLHTAAAYAAERKADILLYGEAVSEEGGTLGEFEGCRARVELKAIATASEQILVADSAYGGATDLAGTVAGKKAIQQAANKLADTFLYSLCLSWNKR